VRRLMATDEGYDPVMWAQMAREPGLQGLAIPERYGGQGFGWTELGIVLEEMGRALVCAPFFSTVVLAATTLLESGDDEAKKDYLPGIADGSVIATVALTEESGRWDSGGVTLPAVRSPDGWTLSGAKHYVLDGTTAQLMIVPARTASGVSLFAVDAGSPGLTRRPSITLDQTRKLAVVEFEETPARLIGAEGGGWHVLQRVLDFAAVALAAEQAGGAQAALDLSVGYLNTAHQNIQFHGGMGFTWEVPAHLYFKRARSSEIFLGDAVAHREALAQRIGI
jgi:alkylation response protein AidB-like acyl-CoA dehydrogenase